MVHGLVGLAERLRRGQEKSEFIISWSEFLSTYRPFGESIVFLLRQIIIRVAVTGQISK